MMKYFLFYLAVLITCVCGTSSCIEDVNDDIGLDMSEYQDQVALVRNYNYEIVDFDFQYEHYNSASPDSCDPGETHYLNVKIKNVSMLMAKENNFLHFSTDESCVTIERNYHEWGTLLSINYLDDNAGVAYWRDDTYDYLSYTFLDLDEDLPYITFDSSCAPDLEITFQIDVYDAPDCYDTEFADCETTKLLESESFQMQLGVDY